MAPTRKSRSVNKRFSYLNEVSPNKDGETSKKSKQRKRKLSDMLGSQWSKDELKQFYKAYRTFGKDWKKVAAAIRNRSVDMVEALYTMNRAYLSLPEGTASVAGLIAMMTDHYCNLDGSDSEQESNDGTGTSRKSQKRPRGIRPNTSKESDMRVPSHSQTVASSSGCLSLLKKRRSGGTRPRAVGKRTPRFPVSYSYEKGNGEKFFSPTKQSLKLKVDANDDDVAHEVALALAEASQRGGSPQVSQTPNRRSESAMSSPTRNGDRMQAELELTSSKLVGSEMDEDGFEGSLGSMEADNVEFSKDKSYKSYTRDTDGMVDSRKGRRLYGKTFEVDDPGNNHLDDIKEACSGTEEGQKLKGKLETGITDGKVSRSSTQGPRKKSKKVLFKRDESFAFDALQTLADLSLMMPETTENESSVQVKEENDDLVVHSGLPDDMPANHHRDRPTYSGVKAKGLTPRLELTTTKTSKSGKVSALDVTAISEAKQEPHQPNTKLPRRKQNTLASKIPKGEAHIDIHLSEPPEIEARDLGKKSANKGKRSSYTALQQKQGKSAKHTENSSSSTDPRREGDDSAASTVQVLVKSQANLPTKVRSKRKVDVEKPQNLKDSKFYDQILNDQRNIPSSLIQDRALNRKEKLSNCLLNPRLRRWCAFEWFYSAVDYPWFAKMEFVEYLYHVGLGHIPRLTRVEWGVIRSSLGKPRRFSEQFLKEEKAKLNQYRDSVRAHYTELRAGTREGLPTDLARPLSVGQRVVAIHPKTREIHDGSVLTVDHTRCRVQFDRPELGVEFVMDIDCMPSNPLENMPAALAKHTFSADKFFENFIEFKMNGRVKDQKPEGYMKYSPHENLANLDRPSHVSPSTYPMSNLLKQGAPTKANSQDKIGSQETATNHQSSNSQSSILAQFQAKEADVQALAELTRALDKKEALTWELRRMNDDVMENQKDGDNSLKDSEPFKKQYAAVLVQLNEANDQVSSALYCLRQRNTYQGNFPLAWPPVANSGDTGGILSSFNCASSDTRDSGSHVDEIVESSRTKARTIVDAAMQAMSSLKGKGSSSEEIEETIDYVSSRLPLDDSCMMAVRSSNPPVTVNGNSASPDQLTACPLNTLYSPDQKLKNGSDKNEAQIPSELISHCVATLLMIQKCTERQFPPADVAQILDSAVTSLQPCCPQNLPVYAEIQKCMGIIKNQILALIPT